MIDKEAELLSNDPAVGDGYSRVVVGGLSQGCAASVFCLLGRGILLQKSMKRVNRLGVHRDERVATFRRGDCYVL